MGQIIKIDTDGQKGLLAQAEFGYDGYADGNDVGRVYVGTGTENIPLAKRSEVTELAAQANKLTSLTANGNILHYTDENGTVTDIDLSLYLDDTNLARLTGGTLDGTSGIATFSRDDGSTFTLDLSALLDDTTVTVEDVLTSSSVANALSANMGRQLKAEQDAITSNLNTLSSTVNQHSSDIADLQAKHTIVEW